ncbi:MAG TPA: efflux RND transporter periplasmic adaptor subunit [Thermoanaerobaculia bacterium]|nr:efflux RND transporter periplasmic adaptor subunit [Thermoanaerobaculia bacterium]
MRRGWAVLALVVAAALFGLWAFSGSRSASAEEKWAQVERQDLVIGIEVTGTLGAVQSVELGPPQLSNAWDFKIAFMAPEGTEVRQGQPVLGFDTSELQNTLLETMAQRDSAQKELEKKLANLEMTRGEDELRLAEAKARARRAGLKVDVPSELVAAKELAESRADLELAEREVAYLENRLSLQVREAEAEISALRNQRDRAAQRVREAEAAIQKMTVLAPRDGTVVYLSDPRREREKKKIGDSAWRGEKILEIPDLRQMRASGEVDEADAGRVAVGQRVVLRLDAHPDVSFTGHVRAIRGAVQTRSPADPVKVVGLDLSLDRTDPQRMRPGMRFLGTIELDRVPRALLVPAGAVFNGPEGPVVFRRTRWGTEEIRPKLGRRNDRWVEIVSGLSEEDAIALRDPRGEAG